MSDVKNISTEVLVLGSGPGGYTAAFRAADLGKKVVLVEKFSEIGGVCLNVGCIPSKALLHAAKVLDESSHMADLGITFQKPRIDTAKLRAWVEKSVIGKLTSGLKMLAKQRKVEVVQGVGAFAGSHQLSVIQENGQTALIQFEHCVIAAGSRPVHLPFLPQDDRIFDSTGALTLKQIPSKLLVIGGGIIGLEMATVYHQLGSQIDIVEFLPQLMNGVDKDIVKPYEKWVSTRYNKILLETKVAKVEAKKEGLYVTFEGKNASAEPVRYDGILQSVGRTPNGKWLSADKAGIQVDEKGFIPVDKQMRTNIPHIFAIGDIVGQPMLAHKAVHEAKVAAEVICGMKHFFEPKVIPSVAYTDPEVAWVGITENQAKEQGISYGKGVFPWAASGKSLSMGRDEGITKVLFDEKTHRIIGCSIVGPNAGDLISEAALAIEMGCDAEDIALTIHPHPTLSESIAMAVEMYDGSITDLIAPKKK